MSHDHMPTLSKKITLGKDTAGSELKESPPVNHLAKTQEQPRKMVIPAFWTAVASLGTCALAKARTGRRLLVKATAKMV